MTTNSKIIEIFCLLDNFSKEYNTLIAENSLSTKWEEKAQ